MSVVMTSAERPGASQMKPTFIEQRRIIGSFRERTIMYPMRFSQGVYEDSQPDQYASEETALLEKVELMGNNITNLIDKTLVSQIAELDENLCSLENKIDVSLEGRLSLEEKISELKRLYKLRKRKSSKSSDSKYPVTARVTSVGFRSLIPVFE